MAFLHFWDFCFDSGATFGAIFFFWPVQNGCRLRLEWKRDAARNVANNKNNETSTHTWSINLCLCPWLGFIIIGRRNLLPCFSIFTGKKVEEWVRQKAPSRVRPAHGAHGNWKMQMRQPHRRSAPKETPNISRSCSTTFVELNSLPSISQSVSQSLRPCATTEIMRHHTRQHADSTKKKESGGIWYSANGPSDKNRLNPAPDGFPQFRTRKKVPLSSRNEWNILLENVFQFSSGIRKNAVTRLRVSILGGWFSVWSIALEMRYNFVCATGAIGTKNSAANSRNWRLRFLAVCGRIGRDRTWSDFEP